MYLDANIVLQNGDEQISVSESAYWMLDVRHLARDRREIGKEKLKKETTHLPFIC